MNQEEIERRMREGRNSLKPLIEEETDYQSDQDLKKPQPPLVKEAMTSNIIALPTDFEHLTIPIMTFSVVYIHDVIVLY